MSVQLVWMLCLRSAFKNNIKFKIINEYLVAIKAMSSDKTIGHHASAGEHSSNGWGIPCNFQSALLMSCKSRAETFARNLHFKLRSLSKTSEQPDIDEDKKNGETLHNIENCTSTEAGVSKSNNGIESCPYNERTHLITTVKAINRLKNARNTETTSSRLANNNEEKLYHNLGFYSPESPNELHPQSMSPPSSNYDENIRDNSHTALCNDEGMPTSKTRPNQWLNNDDIAESGCISSVSSIVTEQDNIDEDDYAFNCFENNSLNAVTSPIPVTSQPRSFQIKDINTAVKPDTIVSINNAEDLNFDNALPEEIRRGQLPSYETHEHIKDNDLSFKTFTENDNAICQQQIISDSIIKDSEQLKSDDLALSFNNINSEAIDYQNYTNENAVGVPSVIINHINFILSVDDLEVTERCEEIGVGLNCGLEKDSGVSLLEFNDGTNQNLEQETDQNVTLKVDVGSCCVKKDVNNQDVPLEINVELKCSVEKDVDDENVSSGVNIDSNQNIEDGDVKSASLPELEKSNQLNVLELCNACSDTKNSTFISEFSRRVTRSSSLKICTTPPSTPNRKKIVRFADAMGLDLEDVKTVFLDDIPVVPKSAYKDLESDAYQNDTMYLYKKPIDLLMCQKLQCDFNKPRTTLIPVFIQPGSLPDFYDKLRRQAVCLESAVVAGFSSVRLVIRVRNFDFHKTVTVRHTFNDWQVFQDQIAEYVDNSNDLISDKFFTVIIWDHMKVGERLCLAIQYKTQGKEFWDNNEGQNYIFQCFLDTDSNSSITEDSWIHFQ